MCQLGRGRAPRREVASSPSQPLVDHSRAPRQLLDLALTEVLNAHIDQRADDVEAGVLRHGDERHLARIAPRTLTGVGDALFDSFDVLGKLTFHSNRDPCPCTQVCSASRVPLLPGACGILRIRAADTKRETRTKMAFHRYTKAELTLVYTLGATRSNARFAVAVATCEFWRIARRPCVARSDLEGDDTPRDAHRRHHPRTAGRGRHRRSDGVVRLARTVRAGDRVWEGRVLAQSRPRTSARSHARDRVGRTSTTSTARTAWRGGI